jgi:hypothetical protein
VRDWDTARRRYKRRQGWLITIIDIGLIAVAYKFDHRAAVAATVVAAVHHVYSFSRYSRR